MVMVPVWVPAFMASKAIFNVAYEAIAVPPVAVTSTCASNTLKEATASTNCNASAKRRNAFEARNETIIPEIVEKVLLFWVIRLS